MDKIIKNIKKGGSFRATLGGCIIEKSKPKRNYFKRILNYLIIIQNCHLFNL